MLYIHPEHFPDGLLDLVAGDPRFLPYFDLPLQHASPSILRAMGRRGDPERNLELLAGIRARLPRAAIRSTFLVGFPGETDEDFTRLLSFQEQARLDWMGAFTYSREEDTRAYSLPGRVTKAVAEKRKSEVESRQIPITERALDARVGETMDVLVEEPVEGEQMSIGLFVELDAVAGELLRLLHRQLDLRGLHAGNAAFVSLEKSPDGFAHAGGRGKR